MADRDDPDRFRFFNEMKRREAERLERFYNNSEERKRWMLKVATGGGMNGNGRRKKPVTLPKMSWEKSDEK